MVQPYFKWYNNYLSYKSDPAGLFCFPIGHCLFKNNCCKQEGVFICVCLESLISLSSCVLCWLSLLARWFIKTSENKILFGFFTPNFSFSSESCALETHDVFCVCEKEREGKRPAPGSKNGMLILGGQCWCHCDVSLINNLKNPMISLGSNSERFEWKVFLQPYLNFAFNLLQLNHVYRPLICYFTTLLQHVSLGFKENWTAHLICKN